MCGSHAFFFWASALGRGVRAAYAFSFLLKTKGFYRLLPTCFWEATPTQVWGKKLKSGFSRQLFLLKADVLRGVYPQLPDSKPPDSKLSRVQA